jgi:hypothetical protein
VRVSSRRALPRKGVQPQAMGWSCGVVEPSTGPFIAVKTVPAPTSSSEDAQVLFYCSMSDSSRVTGQMLQVVNMKLGAVLEANKTRRPELISPRH